MNQAVTMGESFGLHVPIGTNLAHLRGLVSAFALEAGLDRQRVERLVLAVSEAAGNVLEHAQAPGTVSARSDEDGVTVHVIDERGTLTHAHLDRVPAWPPQRGMGLWMMQRLCDRVTLDHPDGRSRLELFMRRAPADEDGQR
ncbi:MULTISPECIES: ATP-binding protein [unclassified Nonomuraea]|uniref:ATP-binding protein n=1 Tax=unclassified Nonomuraea TaxID=2593643 RepID=UPI0033D6A57B